MVFVFLILGLVLLTIGAHWLVKGASQFARIIGVPALAIGLTIVAYGTSSPEMVVSTKAALANQADIAVANVVGSNIFNVLFILGICGLIAPLVVKLNLIKLDVPIMIGVSIVLWLQSLDGVLSRFDGLVLFLGIIVYTVFVFYISKQESKQIEQEFEKEFGKKVQTKDNGKQIFGNLFLVVIGLVLLVIGANYLIDSAIQIARMLGVTETLIGLTIVAAGTSLPEVATSIVATIKGERDIAIGNIIGSNIFNILAILGISSMLAKDGLAVNVSMIQLDIPVMALVAVSCYPIFVTDRVISRLEGFLFFGFYVLYIAYLFLQTTQHPALMQFTETMKFIVLPLTASFLIWDGLRHNKNVKKEKSS